IDHAAVDKHLQYLSKYPGEDATPGILRRKNYIVQRLKEYGLDVVVRTFYPYMADSQAVDVQLEMLTPAQKTLATKEITQAWQEQCDKVSVGFNEGSQAADLVRDVVYVNFGRPADYDYLASIGVDVKNKIVLVRYGGLQRSEVPYQAYL